MYTRPEETLTEALDIILQLIEGDSVKKWRDLADTWRVLWA